MTDGLKDEHREAIIAAIAANDRVERAVLFGSRATGTNTVSSDVDIALFGDRLTLTDQARLAAVLDKLPMAQSVDLLLYDSTLDRTLREQIRRQGVEFYVRSSPRPTGHRTRAAASIGTAVTPNGVETVFGWRRRDVGELIRDGSLTVGDGYRAKNSELAGSGLPFARAGNVADGFRFSDADRFPEDRLHRAGDKTSRPGDVVFTSKGTVGRFAFVRRDTEHFVYSPQLCFWRSLDREVIDPYFLYCWVRGPEFFGQFRGVAGQTDMAEYVSLTDQRRMFITLPPVAEQRTIAHILGTLDDKIELNRRMNATLEAIARALFRSWFVDFDPVRAKMDGRDTGLPKEIADLFPDRLVDSELGEIPDGWVPSRLDSVAAITKGRSYRRRELVASDTALVTLKSFARGGGYRPDGLKPFRGVYKSEQVVQPGEVVVACTDVTQAAEVVGRSAIVGETPSFRTLVASLDILIVRPKSPAPGRVFIYYVTGTDDFVAHALARTTGTTVLHLSKDAVASFRFALPPTPLMERFAHGADVLRARIQTNSSAVGLLAGLRDNLLPKLVSGEVRVTGLEPPNGRDDHPTGRDAWSLTERRP